MTSITERELCAMRDAAEAEMTDRCQVLTRSEARTGTGGVAPVFITGVVLRCSVRPWSNSMGGSREQQIASRLASVSVYAVRIPYGSPVTNADRLVWNGKTLEVNGVQFGSNAIALTCVCSEVS